jgi:hypothetical protein
MRSHRKKGDPSYCFTASLDWNDLDALDGQNSVSTRYDSENRVYVHMIHPFDINKFGSKDASLSHPPYAMFDTGAMDIHMYIPHGALRHSRIAGCEFTKEKKNLTIKPDSSQYDDMRIRVQFPGSVKVVDIGKEFTKAIEGVAEESG